MQVIDAGFNNWISQIGEAINNPPSLAFAATTLPDGRLKVTNVGDRAFAGGLVAAKRPIPVFMGAPPVPQVTCPYALLSTRITVPGTSLYNLARLETDLIAVFIPAPNPSTPIANKANGSTQLNFDTGHFEIDATSGPPSWTDIGAGPGKVSPDIEHALAVSYFFDLARNQVSVLSITWDGTIYTIPPALQKVGFQTSNWTVVAALQLQNEIYNPGAVDVLYRNTALTWSDQAQ